MRGTESKKKHLLKFLYHQCVLRSRKIRSSLFNILNKINIWYVRIGNRIRYIDYANRGFI